MNKIDIYYKEIKEQIITDYKHLHANPELSFNELKTSEYIFNKLIESGIKETYRTKNNAIIAVITGDSYTKTIGLRAELDALPISENTSVDYKSNNNGIMHACGHDLHMASAIGTALILNKLKAKISGRYVIIFQPAEEKLPGGALEVINSKEYIKYKPDIMLGMHVFPDLPAGKVGFRSNEYMASGDEIDIHVKGLGGHAALPHKTQDTILIAAHILIALQQISARFVPANIPSVLTFGNIVSNSVMNVIPKEVTLEGTFRIMDESWRKKSLIHIKQIAKNTALAFGANCEVVIRNGYPSIVNNNDLTSTAINTSKQLIGNNNVEALPIRLTTDDFGYYSQNTPSLYFRLGVGFSDKASYGLHTPEFIPNLESLNTGIPLVVKLMIEFAKTQNN